MYKSIEHLHDYITLKLKLAEVEIRDMERREPLRHHRERKPLHAQRETWCQHLCSSTDLQTVLRRGA